MVRQFAHFLATKFVVAGPKATEVRVRMYVSLNGQRPHLFLDRNINLAAEPPFWGRASWLLKVDEPLPPPGQDFSQGFFESDPVAGLTTRIVNRRESGRRE
jgi:hypothetical protein